MHMSSAKNLPSLLHPITPPMPLLLLDHSLLAISDKIWTHAEDCKRRRHLQQIASSRLFALLQGSAHVLQHASCPGGNACCSYPVRSRHLPGAEPESPERIHLQHPVCGPATSVSYRPG